ncbi:MULTISPECIES: universal stress protein [Comamonas]|uniref:universal stress protein n=1 Tax=Comamonas TaxID=283 RepID=UPI0012C46581|nr:MULTISPECIES: universal stress protein [Comamonas]MDR3067839.1 universal stress protein [Comamonas sp.]MEB5966946.1 universal stress protein [Comamonas testosteroni]MPS95618.1 universal stress protein [Comamonas sp.]
MFKHILIPTDGSKLSEAALQAGMRLAKEQGAQVTALYVMPDYTAIIYGAEALMSYNAAEFDKSAQKEADKVLQTAIDMAAAEGVACKTLRTTSISVNQAIIKTAQDNHCDLICMASHGRKGIAGILLGSETQRVLINSSIPVLVHRP